MSPGKSKLTEQEAAAQFVICIIQMTQVAWPRIYQRLNDMFDGKFVVENEATAAFDLALAAIAQNIQAIRNLFPEVQAERIEKCVYYCIDTEDTGEYAIEEVTQYDYVFRENVRNVAKGGDPVSAIPGRLLHRWLGQNIRNFELKTGGIKTGVLNPVLLVIVSGLLATFLGMWRRMKDDYDIVEDDAPLV